MLNESFYIYETVYLHHANTLNYCILAFLFKNSPTENAQKSRKKEEIFTSLSCHIYETVYLEFYKYLVFNTLYFFFKKVNFFL